jgi:DUF971 family protein
MATSASIEPTAIDVIKAQRVVEVVWGDGHRSRYDFTYLRWRCPCASCRGEMGRPGALDVAKSLTPQQTDLVDLQLVGYYAMCPTWADGHATGIYAFDILRASCPCTTCSAVHGAR